MNVLTLKLKELPDGINCWLFKLKRTSGNLQSFYETMSWQKSCTQNNKYVQYFRPIFTDISVHYENKILNIKAKFKKNIEGTVMGDINRFKPFSKYAISIQ